MQLNVDVRSMAQNCRQACGEDAYLDRLEQLSPHARMVYGMFLDRADPSEVILALAWWYHHGQANQLTKEEVRAVKVELMHIIADIRMALDCPRG